MSRGKRTPLILILSSLSNPISSQAQLHPSLTCHSLSLTTVISISPPLPHAPPSPPLSLDRLLIPDTTRNVVSPFRFQFPAYPVFRRQGAAERAAEGPGQVLLSHGCTVGISYEEAVQRVLPSFHDRKTRCSGTRTSQDLYVPILNGPFNRT